MPSLGILRAATLCLLCLLAPALLAPPAASASRPRSPGGRVRQDLNGDNHADLAIGVPNDAVGSALQAGSVDVLFGSASGLTSAGSQSWTMSSCSNGTPAAGDEFGSAVAIGDFNGDGFSDLAIGVPNREAGSIANAGAVVIVYGSAGGPDCSAALASQVIAQNLAAADNHFGNSLAVGDFDGDGKDDLAVGVENQSVGGHAQAGVVRVLYGAGTGLGARGQLWTRDSAGVAGASAAGALFGHALATGDFNGDGKDDLAVGAPRDPVGSLAGGGSVSVLYGGSGGLSSANNQRWTQNSAGIQGTAAAGDQFGWALAAGDFDGDSKDDLAIGVPTDQVGSVGAAGVVNVLYGASGGLGSARNQLWSLSSTGVLGTAHQGDEFGTALAAGDFDANGADDLAVGVPVASVAGFAGAGSVAVLYGVPGSGLSSANNQRWTQDSNGVGDQAEADDRFGHLLAAANFGNGASADLAVGVPFEDLAPGTDVGAVHVLYGSSANRLRASGSQLWMQGSAGVPRPRPG